MNPYEKTKYRELVKQYKICNEYYLSGQFKEKADKLFGEKSSCLSERRNADPMEHGHLDECIGCKFYVPAKEELMQYVEKARGKAEEYLASIKRGLNLGTGRKDWYLRNEFDHETLMLGTYVARYQLAINLVRNSKEA